MLVSSKKNENNLWKIREPIDSGTQPERLNWTDSRKREDQYQRMTIQEIDQSENTRESNTEMLAKIYSSYNMSNSRLQSKICSWTRFISQDS